MFQTTNQLCSLMSSISKKSSSKELFSTGARNFHHFGHFDVEGQNLHTMGAQRHLRSKASMTGILTLDFQVKNCLFIT